MSRPKININKIARLASNQDGDERFVDIDPDRVGEATAIASRKVMANKAENNSKFPSSIGQPQKIERPDFHKQEDWYSWRMDIPVKEAEKIQQSALKDFETVRKSAGNGRVHLFVKRASAKPPFTAVSFEEGDEGSGILRWVASGKTYSLTDVSAKAARLFIAMNKLGHKRNAISVLRQDLERRRLQLERFRIAQFGRVSFDLDRIEEGEAVLHPSDLLENVDAYAFAGEDDDGNARLVKRDDKDDTQWQEVEVDPRTILPAEHALDSFKHDAENRQEEFGEYQQESSGVDTADEAEDLPSQDEQSSEDKTPQKKQGQQPPVASQPEEAVPEPTQEELDNQADKEIEQQER